MAGETIAVVGFALIVGGAVAYLLRDKIAKKFYKTETEKSRIANDPDLLLEKLKENGKMVDEGNELKYSVVEEGGKRKLSLEKVPVATTTAPHSNKKAKAKKV